jgi:diphthamide synthase (EF-2-diphthine--ammonia ligase)
VLSLGFRAVVVCVDSRHLADEFCGREFDQRFIADLPRGVDACGENGEFHTFVYDGPLFRERVPVRVTAREPYVSPPDLGSVRYCFARLAGGPVPGQKPF